MRNVWNGVWCAVLCSVMACSGHGEIQPDASAFSLGDTSCPATPGQTASIARGTLAGMDATRVFLDSGTGSWPKAGGAAVAFMAQGAGAHLTVNGSYYWIDGFEGVQHRAVVVTDARGAVIRTIPLASLANFPWQLAPAGDAGVYVLTTCSSTPAAECPASLTQTIELIADAASNARTVVAPDTSVKITAFSAACSVLIWAEQDITSGIKQAKKRDATTGAVVPLVTFPDAQQSTISALLIAGDEFFVGFANPGSPFSQIERRALADGALIDTLPTNLGSIATLAYDGDLYFAHPDMTDVGPLSICHIPGDVYRIGISEHRLTQVDGTSAALLLTDGDVLYYTYAPTELCCAGNGQTCPSSAPPPPEVRCYRQR